MTQLTVTASLAVHGVASRAFYAFGRFIAVGFSRVWTRTRVIGAENVPRTGAFVLAPVHRSAIDTPLAAAVTRRRLRFMGKDSLWEARWAGWVLSALGGFPVRRGKADREALRRCIEVLHMGEPVVLFPEGERKSGPVVRPLFDGAAYVAIKSGVPIVPVGIGGSEQVMPKGSKMIRPHKVVVIVGEPITAPADATGPARRHAVRSLTATLHARLQRLFDEAQILAG